MQTLSHFGPESVRIRSQIGSKIDSKPLKSASIIWLVFGLLFASILVPFLHAFLAPWASHFGSQNLLKIIKKINQNLIDFWMRFRCQNGARKHPKINKKSGPKRIHRFSQNMHGVYTRAQFWRIWKAKMLQKSGQKSVQKSMKKTTIFWKGFW